MKAWTDEECKAIVVRVLRDNPLADQRTCDIALIHAAIAQYRESIAPLVADVELAIKRVRIFLGNFLGADEQHNDLTFALECAAAILADKEPTDGLS